MNRSYCTYFDQHYLLQGLALHRSLCRHAQPFTLYVLCLDERTFSLLEQMRLPHVVAISLVDIERHDPALLEAKSDRSRLEYYFTLSPILPLYILRRFPGIDVLVYLDADLYFFEAPASIYEEFGDRSILIVGHRFPPRLRYLEERSGRYNVGFLAFRNDDSARACLEWWRARCLEWCHRRVEDGKFADQKYLDDWPARFTGVHVLKHAGGGLGPWNVREAEIQDQGGALRVEGEPVVFYHFHDLKVTGRFSFELDQCGYGISSRQTSVRLLYGPYLRELQTLMREARGSSAIIPAPRRAAFASRISWLMTAKHWFVIGPVWKQVHLQPIVVRMRRRLRQVWIQLSVAR